MTQNIFERVCPTCNGTGKLSALTLGQRVRLARQSKGWDIGQLVTAVNNRGGKISASTISTVENDKAKGLSIRLAEMIADALDIDIVDLLRKC